MADATLFSPFFRNIGAVELLFDQYVDTPSTQLDDVSIAHSHISVARRAAGVALPSCPVDGDETVAPIGVVLV